MVSLLASVASPPACKHLYLFYLPPGYHVSLSPNAIRLSMAKKQVSNFHSVVVWF